MDTRDVGRRLRTIRLQRGLKQEELAQRSGLSRAYIYRLEEGSIINPKLFDLDRVAGVLQVPLQALLADPDEWHPDEQAQLQQFLSDPDLRVDFFSLVGDMRLENLTPSEKRHILSVIKAALDLWREGRTGRGGPHA